jgi:hypothetical protein
MRVVEDRASGDGKLVIAVLAVKELLRRLQFDSRAFAAQALGTLGPAEAHKQFAASFIGVEQVNHIN